MSLNLAMYKVSRTLIDRSVFPTILHSPGKCSKGRDDIDQQKLSHASGFILL